APRRAPAPRSSASRCRPACSAGRTRSSPARAAASMSSSSWGGPGLAGTHGMEEELACAFAAGRGAVEPVEHREAVRRRRLAQALLGVAVGGRRLDLAAGADVDRLQLELRLDEQ